MLRRFTLRLPAIVMAGLLILGLSERAHADLEVTLGGVSSGAQSGNGTLSFNLSSGSFTSNGTAEGETSLGQPATMDMSTITVNSSSAGSVTLIFSMNNITSPLGLGLITETLTSHFIVGSGSVSYTTYGTNNNTLYTTNPSPGNGSSGTVTTLNGTSSGAFDAIGSGSPPKYSLTEVLTITFNTSTGGNFSLSSDSDANFAVPEPTSMMMAGLGALGFIGYGLRRRKALGA